MSRQKFLNGIAEMNEAQVSSRNFREDAYSGIMAAVSDLDWTPFSSRFIVLVTDASPREFGDEFSKTGMSATNLNSYVREKMNAAIVAMHLRTGRWAKDHRAAEDAYRELTAFPNQPPFYFPIENGDPSLFEQAAQNLGSLLSRDAQQFRNDPGVHHSDGSQPIQEENEDIKRFSGVASASRTMQLAFLGRSEGTKAPDVFDAYVADRDFDRTGLKPLSIRLLITKSQLSALFEALTIIVEKGEENIVDPDQFFDQVLGAAADMSRNPEKVARRADTSLAEAVAIDEYIEDLPYRSRIMGLTQDDWLDMSFSEQAAIINDLYEKISRYQRYNEATDLWVDYLDNGAQADNLLYPMPLDDLP
jgi:serine/threonine-protein kinase PpkA